MWHNTILCACTHITVRFIWTYYTTPLFHASTIPSIFINQFFFQKFYWMCDDRWLMRTSKWNVKSNQFIWLWGYKTAAKVVLFCSDDCCFGIDKISMLIMVVVMVVFVLNLFCSNPFIPTTGITWNALFHRCPTALWLFPLHLSDVSSISIEK